MKGRALSRALRSDLTTVLVPRPLRLGRTAALGKALEMREIKMAAMHPAAIWLIIAAVVGFVLLIATLVANRNQKKKKRGKFFVVSLKHFRG